MLCIAEKCGRNYVVVLCPPSKKSTATCSRPTGTAWLSRYPTKDSRRKTTETTIGEMNKHEQQTNEFKRFSDCCELNFELMNIWKTIVANNEELLNLTGGISQAERVTCRSNKEKLKVQVIQNNFLPITYAIHKMTTHVMYIHHV